MKIVQNSTDSQLHIPAELGDEVFVYQMGAKKHGANSWLEEGVLTLDKNTLSMVRHILAFYMSQSSKDDALALLAELETQVVRGEISSSPVDEESGLSHLLHARWRTGTYYTLWKRGLVGPINGRVK